MKYTIFMKKWIDVYGKKMDAVEFTRFIRQRTSKKINHFLEDIIETENKNTARLKRLQEFD